MVMFRLVQKEETSSTNDEVKRALEAGEAEGLAVCARRQVAGYGRQARMWASPEGGLYLSLLLRPPVSTAALPALSLAVGVAVRRAAASLAASEYAEAIQIKWPNDIVVALRAFDKAVGEPSCSGAVEDDCRFRKLCGISLETHGGGVCVGIGVNVCPPPEPVEVGGKNVPVYLSELGFPVKHGVSPAVSTVCDTVLAELSTVYDLWLAHGFAALAGECAVHLALCGQTVQVLDRGGTQLACGTVEGVCSDGRLLLRAPDGETVRITSGEVGLFSAAR